MNFTNSLNCPSLYLICLYISGVAAIQTGVGPFAYTGSAQRR